MPFRISDECNNCGICEIICPYNAIYPGGVNWRKIHNRFYTYPEDDSVVDYFWSRDHYYIVPERCTECIGKYPAPICISVCPLKEFSINKDHWESNEHLYAKKEFLERIPGKE